MRKLVLASSLFAVTLLAALGVSAAFAHGDKGGRGKASLNSFHEAPMSLSTPGRGTFRIKIASDGIHYTLRYRDLATTVLFAHIHLGEVHQAGGVIAFLCGGGDKPACPANQGEVSGVIDAADVIGPAAQGIAAGELTEVIRAIRNGAVYANVHTSAYPGGEIRGQVGHTGNHGDKNGKRH
jgi:CHRD domain